MQEEPQGSPREPGITTRLVRVAGTAGTPRFSFGEIKRRAYGWCIAGLVVLLIAIMVVSALVADHGRKPWAAVMISLVVLMAGVRLVKRTHRRHPNVVYVAPVLFVAWGMGLVAGKDAVPIISRMSVLGYVELTAVSAVTLMLVAIGSVLRKRLGQFVRGWRLTLLNVFAYVGAAGLTLLAIAGAIPVNSQGTSFGPWLLLCTGLLFTVLTSNSARFAVRSWGNVLFHASVLSASIYAVVMVFTTLEL